MVTNQPSISVNYFQLLSVTTIRITMIIIIYIYIYLEALVIAITTTSITFINTCMYIYIVSLLALLISVTILSVTILNHGSSIYQPFIDHQSSILTVICHHSSLFTINQSSNTANVIYSIFPSSYIYHIF